MKHRVFLYIVVSVTLLVPFFVNVAVREPITPTLVWTQVILLGTWIAGLIFVPEDFLEPRNRRN